MLSHVTHCKCGFKAQINLHKSVIFNNLIRNHVEKVYFKCFHRTLLTIYTPEINIQSHQSHVSCNSRKIPRRLNKSQQASLLSFGQRSKRSTSSFEVIALAIVAEKVDGACQTDQIINLSKVKN